MSPMQDRKGPAWGPMFLTSAAVAALLSLGLCGAGFAMDAKGHDPWAILFKLGVACIGLTVLFGVVGIIALIIEASNSR